MSGQHRLALHQVAQGVALTDPGHGKRGRHALCGWRGQAAGIETQQLQLTVGAPADRLAVLTDLQQGAVGLRHNPLAGSANQQLALLAGALAQHQQVGGGAEQLGGIEAAQQLRGKVGGLFILALQGAVAI